MDSIRLYVFCVSIAVCVHGGVIPESDPVRVINVQKNVLERDVTEGSPNLIKINRIPPMGINTDSDVGNYEFRPRIPQDVNHGGAMHAIFIHFEISRAFSEEPPEFEESIMEPEMNFSPDGPKIIKKQTLPCPFVLISFLIYGAIFIAFILLAIVLRKPKPRGPPVYSSQKFFAVPLQKTIV